MKKSLLVILTFLFTLGLVAQAMIAPDGSGTENNPYQISTYENLNWLTYRADDTEVSYLDRLSAHYIQTSDIEFPDSIHSWNEGAGFTPIGWGSLSQSFPFSGSYNGQNHSITNLFMMHDITDNIALFGLVISGTIQNLGLENVYIIGAWGVAGLVGEMDTNSLVNNCFVKGTIIGESIVGGITAYNFESEINNCYFIGTLEALEAVGGIAGYNDNATITNSYSVATVSDVDYAGILVGLNDTAIIHNSFWDAEIAPGFPGIADNTDGNIINVVGKTTAELKTETTFTSAGWNFTDLWLITDEMNDSYPSFIWETVVEIPEEINPPTNLTATITGQNVTLNWLAPAINLKAEDISSRFDRTMTGYKIYRDSELIAVLENTILTYSDSDLVNGNYIYNATAMYGTTESASSNNVTAQVTHSIDIILEDSFETYGDFAISFGNWTLWDRDGSETYNEGPGGGYVTYPHDNDPMAFMVFNPAMTTPPLTSEYYTPLSGNKFLICPRALYSQNNDWLISEQITVTEACRVSFSAKSRVWDSVPERFYVLVSPGTLITEDFESISGDSYTEPPANWTEYNYSLEAYANQTIRIAVRSVSDAAQTFMLDDFKVYYDPYGITDNDTSTAPELTFSLNGNYPNPFNPSTTISYTLQKAGDVTLEVYNILGQKVKTLVNDSRNAGPHTVVWNGRDDNGKSVASGLFFYKMKSGKYSSTKKMILMK